LYITTAWFMMSDEDRWKVALEKTNLDISN